MLLNFDPKVIPLFNGKDSDLSMQKWIKKELICQLSGIKCIECIIPMCLSVGVYAVYQQLSKDKRSALYMVFALLGRSSWGASYVEKKLFMYIWLNYRDSQSCLEECQKKAWCVHLLQGCQRVLRNYSEPCPRWIIRTFRKCLHKHRWFWRWAPWLWNSQRLHNHHSVRQKRSTHRQPAINVMSPITWTETAFFGINP